MKQLHLPIMLSILLSMFTVHSYAHDIEVKNADGITIYYKWMNGKSGLSVTYRGDFADTYPYEYQGEVVIPASVIYGGEEYPVTSIGQGAFRFCETLISVTIPSSVTSIEQRAFGFCQNLTSITIPNSVTSIGESAFEFCGSLTSFNLPSRVTSIANGTFEDCISLTSFDIPNRITSIGDGAFCNCQGLSSIIIPNSVRSIGSSAFHSCIGLTSVTIPKTVTFIGEGAFSYCSSLTTLKVEDGNRIYDSRDNCNVIIETATNKLIATCQATTSIPNNVESIGEYAFGGCTSLTSITIPSGVTSIGERAFEGCNGLTSITIPDDVPCIEEYTFAGCEKLTSVTMGNRIVSIGACAFLQCKSLSSIIIPNSVLSIGKWAFDDCLGLTSVIIGNSVMVVDDGAFQNCRNLTSITIPSSVTSIGSTAFEYCKSLREVICLAEKVPSYGYSSYGMSSIHQNATLKVPEKSIELYKAQKPWSDFGEIVVYSPDNEAANSVIAKIKAIGKVVYTDVSKARIDAARKAYEALTDVQKALVTNLETLIAAEAKYLELQEMANGINVVSVDDAENIWYDLSGRQLCKKPVTKGIYILNDKTVLIK